MKLEADPDQTLRHRHFRTAQAKTGGSPTLDRMPLLFNQDIAMLVRRARRGGRALLPQRAGRRGGVRREGEGHARDGVRRPAVPQGDYLVIHRGILHRYRFDAAHEHAEAARSSRAAGTSAGPSAIATSSASSWKARRTPSATSAVRCELNTHDEMGDFPLLVKQYDGINELMLDHHPFDVVGWDGYFYPWAFNINDFEPIVGRIHQPPPVHQTFQGDGFVVCSFCPRPYDFDPERGARAVQPQQRRLRRGALLRVERVHEPEGHRVRLASRIIPTAFRTARIRAAPRRRSARRTPTSWR